MYLLGEICLDGFQLCCRILKQRLDLGDLSLGKLLVRDCLLLQKLLVCRKLLLGKLFICSNLILIQLAVRCKLLLARTLYLRNLPRDACLNLGHLRCHTVCQIIDLLRELCHDLVSFLLALHQNVLPLLGLAFPLVDNRLQFLYFILLRCKQILQLFRLLTKLVDLT